MSSSPFFNDIFHTQSRASPTVVSPPESPTTRNLSSPLVPDTALFIHVTNASCISFRHQGVLTLSQLICLDTPYPIPHKSTSTNAHTWWLWCEWLGHKIILRINDVLYYTYRVTGWNLVFLFRIPIYLLRALRFSLRTVAFSLGITQTVLSFSEEVLGIVA